MKSRRAVASRISRVCSLTVRTSTTTTNVSRAPCFANTQPLSFVLHDDTCLHESPNLSRLTARRSFSSFARNITGQYWCCLFEKHDQTILSQMPPGCPIDRPLPSVSIYEPCRQSMACSTPRKRLLRGAMSNGHHRPCKWNFSLPLKNELKRI